VRMISRAYDTLRWVLMLPPLFFFSYVVRILGYSLTLQLDFTKLVALTFLLGAGVALWIRYRVLNKYSELKEPP
jgi:hypothetical protein